jgi:hypothetical protein
LTFVFQLCISVLKLFLILFLISIWGLIIFKITLFIFKVYLFYYRWTLYLIVLLINRWFTSKSQRWLNLKILIEIYILLFEFLCRNLLIYFWILHITCTDLINITNILLIILKLWRWNESWRVLIKIFLFEFLWFLAVVIWILCPIIHICFFHFYSKIINIFVLIKRYCLNLFYLSI